MLGCFTGDLKNHACLWQSLLREQVIWQELACGMIALRLHNALLVTLIDPN